MTISLKETQKMVKTGGKRKEVYQKCQKILGISHEVTLELETKLRDSNIDVPILEVPIVHVQGQKGKMSPCTVERRISETSL